ncbi:MAG: hypothetical protein Q9174_000445 [Haloplaca sp. 1 TL-2023]
MPATDHGQPFGLQELYCPTFERINADTIDVVAVHGLNGDVQKTWTSEKNNICWLSDPDLLPKYLPNARILSWGYNANVMSTGGRATSADKILQHAQTLIAALAADREVGHEDLTERND